MSEVTKRKNMVITGTSRGIGKFLAEYYIKKGFNVFGISRSDSSIDMEYYSHSQLDLENSNEIMLFYKNFKKENKYLDVFINNAGTLTSMNSLIIPQKSVESMINTNIKANFFMSREAAKIMMLHKKGRVINIGSMASILKPKGDSVYAMTKSAISNLSQVLSKEYSEYGITNNTLDITYIETDLSNKIDKSAIKEIISNLPIPRPAKFEDITNVIDFYLLEESGYITGQSISLGGL